MKSRRQLVMEVAERENMHTIAYSKSTRETHIDARGKIDDEANTLSTGDGCVSQSTGNYVFTEGDVRIRKLTPVECERLQGYPPTLIRLGITLCLDQAKNYVDVVNRNPKLLEHVLTVGKDKKLESVNAELNSCIKDPQTRSTAHFPVGINTLKEESKRQTESLTIVNTVENQTQYEDQGVEGGSVTQSVFINITEGRITHFGKGEFPTSGIHTTLQGNGRYVLNMSGKEIMQHVEDAERGLEKGTVKSSTFTISNHLDTDSSYLSLAILYYYAKDVITGYIPEITLSQSLSLTMEFTNGHTRLGRRPDGIVYEISNTQRYKLCGNGISSPVPAHLFPAIFGHGEFNILDLFSGCHGTGLLLPPNFKTVAFAEIDKYASDVLRYHYSNIPNLGSVTEIVNRTDVPNFNMLVGGFPCQSWSISGLRKGFDDARGQLIYNVFDILRKFRPQALVLENVKGLLTKDNGDAFEAIMEYLSELGYELDFEVVNSKNFGLAQNRERVFIFGKLK